MIGSILTGEKSISEVTTKVLCPFKLHKDHDSSGKIALTEGLY